MRLLKDRPACKSKKLHNESRAGLAVKIITTQSHTIDYYQVYINPIVSFILINSTGTDQRRFLHTIPLAVKELSVTHQE